MAVTKIELESLIHDSFPEAIFNIDDLAGDGNHYRLTIESPNFQGKTRIQQHQMVYQALGSRMGAELHALALITKCPIKSK